MSAAALFRRAMHRQCTRRALLFVLTAAALLAPMAGPGYARSPVAGKTVADLPDVSLTVYTYWPDCHDPGLLLVFHGNSRTAERYRDYARPLADRACLIVFAPLFDADRFPNWAYHRGGLVHSRSARPADQWTTRPSKAGAMPNSELPRA